MGINFPNAPAVGQQYPAPPVAGLPVYQWDGEKWTTGIDTRIPTYAFGQCRFMMNGSTGLFLGPYNGNLIKINGVLYEIPSSGIAYTASGLTAGTVYYAYVYWNGSALAIELSTTGHVTSTQAGNVGTEIKSGDNSRTLVGMAYAVNSTGGWSDSLGLRQVRSWFNENGVTAAINAGDVQSTASGTPVEVANTRLYLLRWMQEHWFIAVGGQCWNTTQGQITYGTALLDGTGLSGTQGVHQSAVANIQSQIFTSYTGVFGADGYSYVGYGQSVSGGTGSVAAREVSIITTRH